MREYPEAHEAARSLDYGPLLGRVEAYEASSGTVIVDRPVRLCPGEEIVSVRGTGIELSGQLVVFEADYDAIIKVWMSGGCPNPAAGDWLYYRLDNRPYAIVVGPGGKRLARLRPGDTYTVTEGLRRR